MSTGRFLGKAVVTKSICMAIELPKEKDGVENHEAEPHADPEKSKSHVRKIGGLKYKELPDGRIIVHRGSPTLLARGTIQNGRVYYKDKLDLHRYGLGGKKWKGFLEVPYLKPDVG